MRRIAAWTTATLLSIGVLAGCSDGEYDTAGEAPSAPVGGLPSDDASTGLPAPTEPDDPVPAGGDYCDLLRTAQDSFDQFDPEEFEATAALFRQIADAAPDEVAADWDQLLGALDALTTALDEAGLSFGDFADPEALATLDPETLQRISELAEQMESGTEEATTAIEEHALAECDVDLNE